MLKNIYRTFVILTAVTACVPQGVLRIHLVEAQNLVAKDKFMGKGKSDPYANIRIGGLAFRSRAIEKNLNPTWNELYEVQHNAARVSVCEPLEDYFSN